MPPDTPTLALSTERIERAAHDVHPAFRATPQSISTSLSSQLGFEVLIKVETVNPIRSFKGRGTDFLVQHSDAEVLMCASAGNLGQGAHDRRAVPWPTGDHLCLARYQRGQGFGHAVAGRGRASGRGRLRRGEGSGRDRGRQHGWQLVVDGRDPALAEGAGGMAVELINGAIPIDVVLVPVGNGSLACGVAHWVNAVCPHTRVIAVGSVGAPAMQAAWRTGDLTTGAPTTTIAEGLAARVPVPEAIGSLRASVDHFVLVDDDALVRAMRALLSHTGLVTEPSGAAALAGAWSLRSELAGATVALPLTGANIDRETLGRLLAI